MFEQMLTAGVVVVYNNNSLHNYISTC